MLVEIDKYKVSDRIRNGIHENSSFLKRMHDSKYSQYLRHCVICGNPFVDRHHIVPKEMFGQDIEENIDYLCSNHHRIVHFLLDIEMQKDNMHKKIRKQNQRLALYQWILLYEPDAIDYFENRMKPVILKRFYEIERELENACGH